MTDRAPTASFVSQPLRRVPALIAAFPELAPPVHLAGAAVTIVLRDGLTEPEVLLIERAANPSDPASGQVALPGGHVDDGDGSLATTALRELEEEVGLARSDLTGSPRFVGTGHAHRFGIRVAVFVAELAPEGRGPGVRSTHEVAHVFWLPLSELGRLRRVTADTTRGPAEVSATVYDGHVLWGFTRRVLREFLGMPSDDGMVGPVFDTPPRSSDAPPTAR